MKKRAKVHLPLRIRAFEYDRQNERHIAEEGVDSTFIELELRGDRPVYIHNPPAKSRSATHVMLAADYRGVIWAVPIVTVDVAAGVWRPITIFQCRNVEWDRIWRRS